MWSTKTLSTGTDGSVRLVGKPTSPQRLSECENCGREVSGTLICLSHENAKLMGFEEYFLFDDDDCSQKSSFPI